MVTSTVVGDPHDPATFVGPMVSARQRDRVRGYINLGLAEGARVVAGGPDVPDGLEQGYYIQPTLFAEVDNAMRIAQEEIFGPVLSVIRYRDEAEAISIANDSAYGLGGGVWTADVDHGPRHCPSDPYRQFPCQRSPPAPKNRRSAASRPAGSAASRALSGWASTSNTRASVSDPESAARRRHRRVAPGRPAARFAADSWVLHGRFEYTHQKTLLVDGSTAVIMTANLTSEYYSTSRDFLILDTKPADLAAIAQVFNADFAQRSVHPGDGRDLVWSPTDSQAQLLGVIDGARKSLRIYSEERGDTTIEDALIKAAHAASTCGSAGRTPAASTTATSPG